MAFPATTNEGSPLEDILEAINSCQGKSAMILVSLTNLATISSGTALSTRSDVIDLFIASSQGVLRPKDALIVVGEDKLVLVLDNLIDVNHLKLAGMKLARSFAMPVELDLQTIKLEVFCGIVYLARQISSIDALDMIYKKAETALHTAIEFDEAQQAGENFHFYIAMADDTANMDEHWQVSQDLRQAIAEHHISMDYQPKIELETGVVVGAEALVRWRYNGEVRPPHSYLPALSSGLMWELTQYCFRLLMRNINDYGLDLPLSINLEHSCLYETDLLRFLDQESTFWGIDHDRITLEITYTKELFNPGLIRETIHALRAHGFKISIDDFACSRAALETLRDLPADEVKIHSTLSGNSFTEPENQLIMQRMMELAHSLSITPVALSIEDSDTLRQMAQWGCQLGQGFYLGAPMPIDKLTALG